MTLTMDEIASRIRNIPDFPKPGIVFKDITPVLEDCKAFQSLVQHFVTQIDPRITKIMAVESRGFIFGAAVAQHLNAGLVLVRKPGKLPRATISHSYELEYGTDTLQIHEDALNRNDRVAIIDDILATGGTARAVEKLCELTQVSVLGSYFFMEIQALNGREKLQAPVHSLLKV